MMEILGLKQQCDFLEVIFSIPALDKQFISSFWHALQTVQEKTLNYSLLNTVHAHKTFFC